MPGRDGNPYVGPKAFAEDDSRVFFGRETETQQLASLVIARRAILLYAPSGAGKTSLIQAGAIPYLKETGKLSDEELFLCRVGGDAVPRPEAASNVYVANALLSGYSAANRPLAAEEVATLSLIQGLARYFPEAGPGRPRPHLLIVDQFEELFTTYAARYADRDVFFAELGACLDADPRLTLLLSMREDHIAKLDPFVDHLPDRLRTRLRLELLGEAAACRAIQGPARKADVEFTDAAAAKLVYDLRLQAVRRPDGTLGQEPGPHVEPVQLQVVCHRLWAQKFPPPQGAQGLPAKARRITEADIEAVGDVDSALAGYYDARVAATATQARAGERAIRKWFDERLISAEGTRGVVVQGPEQSAGLDNRAVRQLVGAHLLRREERRDVVLYELVHDRFIQPIRDSNARWRARRRRARLTWAVPGAILVLAALVILTLLSRVELLQRNQELTSLEATAAAQAEQANRQLTAVEATATAQVALQAELEDRMSQAAGHREEGDYAKAIATYTEIIRDEPHYASAFYWRGRTYDDVKQFDEAIIDYTAAIIYGHEPLSWPYNSRGNAYRDRGDASGNDEDLQRALDDFTKAIELEDVAMYYSNRGLGYVDLDDYEAAFDDFDRAIQVDPSYVRAYVNRGRVYREQGKYQEAIADFTTAINKDHEPLSWPYYYRGITYVRMDDFKQAIDDLSEAIRLDTSYVNAYYARAGAYREEDNYELALTDYNTVIALSPEHAGAYDGRGWTYHLLEDYEQALQDLARAIELDPDYALAYYHRGLLYAELGETEKAREDLTTFLELADPSLPEEYRSTATETLETLQEP